MTDNFYQRVAEESAHALLCMAWSHAKDRNLDAMMNILEVLENDTACKLMVAKCHVPLHAHHAYQGNLLDSTPQSNDAVSFPKTFAHALRPMDAEDTPHEVKWTALQAHLFERALTMFRSLPMVFVRGKNENPVLDAEFFLEGLKVVKDPDFYVGLGDKFKDLRVTSLSRALENHNTVALIEVLKHTSFDKRFDFTYTLAPQDGHATKESDKLIKKLAHLIGPHMGKKGGLLDFLDTLERMVNSNNATPVRMGLMRCHLDGLSSSKTGMDLDVVRELEQLAGKGGMNPSTSLLPASAQRSIDVQRLFGGFKSEGKALHETTDAALMLMRSAIRHHCVPLMKAMGPLLKACANNLPLMQVALEGRPDVQVAPESFKAAIVCLMAHGETLEKVKEENAEHGFVTVRESALAELARMKEHPGDEQKIAILLDMGANPKPLAGSKFSGGKDHRDRWNHVVQSHAARQAARSLVAEIEMEMEPCPKGAARP